MLRSFSAIRDCGRRWLFKSGRPIGVVHLLLDLAGLVERHVALQKLTMLKMKAECDSQGLVAEHDEICAEAGMAQNLTLSFGGYTPAQAAIARNPKAFCEVEDSGLLSVLGALESGSDFVERARRFRTRPAKSHDDVSSATSHLGPAGLADTYIPCTQCNGL